MQAPRAAPPRASSPLTRAGSPPTSLVPSGVPTLTQLALSAAAKYLEHDHVAIARLPEDLVEKVLAWMIERLPPNQHRQINQSINVKVNLTRQNHTWSFRFLQSMSIRQAVQEIYARLTDDPFTVTEYALFLRATDSYTEDQWLEEERTFGYYELKSGVHLEFRPRKTPVQIDFLGHWEKIIHPLHQATLEGTSKTFLIDEAQSVARMAEDIARKLGLRFPHEFMLKLPTHDPTVPARWLNPDLTLAEQKVDPLQTAFFFCKMYSFNPWTESVTRETEYSQLHSLFSQCVDAIVNVLYPCTLQEAIYLAALQCQSTYGDYGVMSFNGIDLKTGDYLPPEHASRKGAKDMILEIYQKMKGMSEVKAKTEYVRLARSLKSYGYTCFPVRRVVLKTAKRNSKDSVSPPVMRKGSTGSSGTSPPTIRKGSSQTDTSHLYLGLSYDSVIMLDVHSKQLLHKLPITQVQKWQLLHSSISIFCTDGTYEFLTEEAASVSAVLNAYITFNLRNQPDVQHRWSQTYARIGREYRRSRSGTDTDSREYQNPPPTADYHQCPLYVEPKKIYRSPIAPGARPVRPPSTGPGAHPSVNPIKLNKIVKMVKALNLLAGKMVQPEVQVARRTLRLNVQFANHHLESFDFPDTRTVADIATDIGRHLGIRNPEEFSLQAEGGLWLNPYLSIEAQNVDPQQTVLFKRKFFYNEESEDFTQDPIYYNLLFYQSRDEILGNTYATNMEEAVQLAGTLFQINFGDWNENIHKPGFLHPSELKFFLQPACLDLWGVNFSAIEKMIYAEHRKLLGMSRPHAKFRYLLLCKQLKSYGTTLFPVRPGGKDGKKLKPHPNVPYTAQTLGCSRDKITVVDQRTKFPLTHLHGWTYDSATMLFSFWFGNYEEEKFSFYTSEGPSISQWLSHYVDFLQSKMMGRLWSRDLGVVTLA